jgi:hypothetical protein
MRIVEKFPTRLNAACRLHVGSKKPTTPRRLRAPSAEIQPDELHKLLETAVKPHNSLNHRLKTASIHNNSKSKCYELLYRSYDHKLFITFTST